MDIAQIFTWLMIVMLWIAAVPMVLGMLALALWLAFTVVYGATHMFAMSAGRVMDGLTWRKR